MHEKIALSGTCYWCLQAVLDHMKGTSNTRIGWYQHESDKFEVVTADWDPRQLPLAELLRIHLRMFCQGSAHALRIRYPHGIYFDNPDIIAEATGLLEQNPQASHLHVAATRELIAADERYQHLFLRYPRLPFCRRIVAPKLETFFNEFSELSRTSTTTEMDAD